MCGAGFTDASHGVVELGLVVFDDARCDQHFAVEVAEHPLGTGLGTIDGHDAEVLRADRLHARLDHSQGLAQEDRTGLARWAGIS